MSGIHEPREEFVARLEAQVAAEARRRTQATPAPRWLTASPIRIALAVVALVVVSMSIGGAVVGAAYQAQNNERRDLLVSSHALQLEVARERLEFARQQLRDAEGRVSLGLGSQDGVGQARFKVTEAEVQVESLELRIAEIRLTGQEPLSDVAAPRVAGRDFVGERWRVDRRAPQAALELERERLLTAERRVAIGLEKAEVVEASRARMVELESALASFDQRLAIRQRFLDGQIDATLAGLRVLEAEAIQQLSGLVPRVELARIQLDNVTTKVEVGLMAPVEEAEARMNLRQLEADLAKAELDLALIRKRIEEHGG